MVVRHSLGGARVFDDRADDEGSTARGDFEAAGLNGKWRRIKVANGRVKSWPGSELRERPKVFGIFLMYWRFRKGDEYGTA